jgi:hypothetical protein
MLGKIGLSKWQKRPDSVLDRKRDQSFQDFGFLLLSILFPLKLAIYISLSIFDQLSHNQILLVNRFPGPRLVHHFPHTITTHMQASSESINGR